MSSTLRNLSTVYREQGQLDKAEELDKLTKQKVCPACSQTSHISSIPVFDSYLTSHSRTEYPSFSLRLSPLQTVLYHPFKLARVPHRCVYCTCHLQHVPCDLPSPSQAIRGKRSSLSLSVRRLFRFKVDSDNPASQDTPPTS